MTTGRINQVTTFPNSLRALHQILGSQKATFLGGSSSSVSIISTRAEGTCSHVATNVSPTAGQNRLVPRSHIIQTHRFLFVTTKITVFQENYQQPAKQPLSFTKVTVDSRIYSTADMLSHPQVVHIPHSLQAQKIVHDPQCQLLPTCKKVANQSGSKGPFQISISCNLQEGYH
jgi:hypothetical protein